jgi:hypothetical protein
MGFGFRSIKLLTGIRINLGKRSVSVSLGGRGAHVTLRPGCKLRATVLTPGISLSFREGGDAVHNRAPGIMTELPSPSEVTGITIGTRMSEPDRNLYCQFLSAIDVWPCVAHESKFANSVRKP